MIMKTRSISSQISSLFLKHRLFLATFIGTLIAVGIFSQVLNSINKYNVPIVAQNRGPSKAPRVLTQVTKFQQRVPSRVKKIRIDTQNQNVVLIGINDGGNEVTLSDLDLKRVKDILAEEEIVLTSDGTEIVFSSRGVAAISEFPLIIDLETKNVSMIIPDNEKVIYFLPDKILEQLLGSGTMTTFQKDEEKDASLKARLGTTKGHFLMALRQGEPVYITDALKQFNMFGIYPVTFPLTVTVSAYSGRIMNINRSLIAAIVDVISP